MNLAVVLELRPDMAATDGFNIAVETLGNPGLGDASRKQIEQYVETIGKKVYEEYNGQ
jgi:hypothetical protein